MQINHIEQVIVNALNKRSSKARAKHANTAEEDSHKQDKLYRQWLNWLRTARRHYRQHKRERISSPVELTGGVRYAGHSLIAAGGD